VLALVVAPRSSFAVGPVSKEHQIKAAFLYNFTRYVDWPAERFESDEAPLVIVVLGRHPIEQELASLAKERSARGRPVLVRAADSAAELGAAHLVFVPAGEESRLPPAPDTLHGVLTVGESPEFTRRGGVITFTVLESKIRFEINQTAGERARLKLSGQLLKLATVLRKEP
jgi:hypothetical protein